MDHKKLDQKKEQLNLRVYDILHKINNNQLKFDKILSQFGHNSTIHHQNPTIQTLSSEIQPTRIKMIVSDLNQRQKTRILPHNKIENKQKIILNRRNNRSNHRQNNTISHMNFQINNHYERRQNSVINKMSTMQEPSQLVLKYDLKSNSPQKIIRQKQLQKIVQIQNSEQRTFSKRDEEMIKNNNSLSDANEKIVLEFFNQNLHLTQNSLPEEYYEFFEALCNKINFHFQNPLMKKYLNCIYFGQNSVKQQKKLYQGFLYHFNQKIYFGGFNNGQKHGRGCQILKDGTISKGRFNSGEKIGMFYVYKKNVFQYEGEIQNNDFHGKGILITKKFKYQGQFKNGMKHGKGIQTNYNKNITYKGQYVNNEMEGTGQISSKNYYYEGGMKEGNKNGYGYEKSDIEEYKGEFIKGKRQGKGVLAFCNGDIYSGQFKDGFMHGIGQLKYSNNRIVKGRFEFNIFAQEQKKNYYQARKNKKPKQIIQLDEDYQEQQNFLNFQTPSLNPQVNNGLIVSNKKINNIQSEQMLPFSNQRKQQKLSRIISQEVNGLTTPVRDKRIRSNKPYKGMSLKSNSQDIKFDYSSLAQNQLEDVPRFPSILKGIEKY